MVSVVLSVGIIYVVDSADFERLSLSRDELHSVLASDELRGVPVVVLANKQDLPSKQTSGYFLSLNNSFFLKNFAITFDQ